MLRLHSVLTLALWLGLALLLTPYGQAQTQVLAPLPAPQEQKQEQKPPPKQVKAKKIVVTGSYIRRAIDEGSPSPVATVDNTKAQEAATFSAGGMMNDNAIISSGTSPNIEFHGQSSANNLVLLNGMRLPKPGGNASVNIDFIPASAIERVEILKDGASALYGSEALAGVVNIITKKEYEGSNVSIRHTRPQKDGFDHSFATEANITATYGKGFKNGNILGVIQYRGNRPLNYSETQYGMKDVLLRGSDASNPGNLVKVNSPKANYHAADCQNVDSKGLCRYNYYDSLQLSSQTDYYNSLLSTGWNVGDGVRVEAALVYTREEDKSSNTPVILRFTDQTANGGDDYSISGTAAAPWAGNLKDQNGNTPTINPGDKFNLLYSPDQELGNRLNRASLDAGAVQFSVGKESDNLDWHLSTGYSASYSQDTMYNGNARRDLVYNKITSNQWNPFTTTTSKDSSVLNDTRIQTWNNSFSDILDTRFIVSGKEIDWGQKSIYAAVGLEHQLQSYHYRVDQNSLNNLTLTGSGSNQNGSRNVISSFIELTQNPIPNLQLQLAGRFDAYSDFGTTINPKLAAAYKFSDTVTMRASYGTGFKAPDLRALYQGDLSTQQRIRDEVSCQAKGENDPSCNTLVATTNGGDPNLKPELGQHFNVGIQIRPKKNWQINIDHWRAQGDQAITGIGNSLLTRLTQVENQYGSSALSQLGVTIERENGDPHGAITHIRYPLKTNSGRYKVNGIDIEIKYKSMVNPFHLGPMNFSFRFDHSHTLKNESQAFFFLPIQNQFNLNWKNIMSFSLSRGNHLASWRIRTYPGGDKGTAQTDASIGIGSTPLFSEHDLHYEYYGAWNGIITFGVRNIFNTLYYNEYNRSQSGFLLPASATMLGRTFYIGYSQDF